MALEKTISANGSHGKHTFTLKVTEDSTNTTSSFMGYTFKLSPIQTGWRWSGWGSKIYYEITFKYRKQGESQDTVLKYTGNIPSYDGSSVVTLKSGTNIEIPHDPDGTRTINISFKVTDTANGKNSSGQYYTPGNANTNDNFVLSVLHTPPTINSVAIQEMNATLTGLNIDDDEIVQFLSQKKFTITSTLYDSATVSSCSVYHNNVLIGTANSNEVTVDFSTVSELMTTETGGVNYTGLMVVVTDSLGGSSSTLINYETIKYFKPVVEKTSTSIKRKTGSGVVLTDNKANLNFVGSAYKTNDAIGNNNTPIVEYKIWNTTEPGSYTTVSSTITDNSVTVTNYELSNIVFTNVYNYKIRIRDSFGNTDEKEGSIPTGQSVWTEYKDRVDFLKATVGGKDVLTIDDLPTETELYYDQTGTNTTVQLSDDTANYTYLEIYYYASSLNKSEKVYLPDGKKVSLDVNSYYTSGNDLYQYFYTKIIEINGSSITVEKNVELRILNNSINNHTTNNNIYITRVVGIK